MKENIKKWIIEWFEENCDVENKEIQNSLNDNYFNNGWIDSLKFIVFVEKIESNFNIRFSNEEFQNEDFAIIEGLTKLIHLKINE